MISMEKKTGGKLEIFSLGKKRPFLYFINHDLM